MLEINEWVDAKDLPDGIEKEVYFDPQTRGFYTVRISTDHARQCYWRRPCRKIGRLARDLSYSHHYRGDAYYYATVELAGGRRERVELWNPRKGNLWRQPFVLETNHEWRSSGPRTWDTGRYWVYGFDRTDFARAYDEPFFGFKGRVVYTDKGPMRMLGHKVAVPA